MRESGSTPFTDLEGSAGVVHFIKLSVGRWGLCEGVADVTVCCGGEVVNEIGSSGGGNEGVASFSHPLVSHAISFQPVISPKCTYALVRTYSRDSLSWNHFSSYWPLLHRLPICFHYRLSLSKELPTRVFLSFSNMSFHALLLEEQARNVPAEWKRSAVWYRPGVAPF